MTEQGSLLILGLGNVLCGDDGLGVAAVDLLHRRYRFTDGVRVLDGGTLGLSLLSLFESDGDVILVDAVAADLPPGSFVRLEGDEVAPAVRHRLSVHQIGVADLLDALRLLDAFPSRMVLLGLVPDTLELGLDRSGPVVAALPRLVEAVAEEALRMGYQPARREELDEADETDPPGLLHRPLVL